MENKLPKKIPIQGKKLVKYRLANPKIVIAIILPILIALPLIIGIMIYFFDTTVSADTFIAILSFATAIVALTFSICLYVISMVTQTHDKIESFCLRVEKIKLHMDKPIFEIKNIGSSNVNNAEVSLTINNNPILKNEILNFLPVNSIINFSLDFTLRWIIIKKINYGFLISINNSTTLLLYFEQKMKSVNGEYIIDDNTCEFRKRMYYKWFI